MSVKQSIALIWRGRFVVGLLFIGLVVSVARCASEPSDATSSTAAVGQPSANQVPLDPFDDPEVRARVADPSGVRAHGDHATRRARSIRHEYTVSVAHTTAQMLPPGLPGDDGARPSAARSRSRARRRPSSCARVPGSVFDNTRGIPTLLRWRDEICQPTFMPVDPTLHWANPLNLEPPTPPFTPFPPGYQNAQFPVAHVTHTHGLVVQAQLRRHGRGVVLALRAPRAELREPRLRHAQRAAGDAALLSRPRDGRDPARRVRRERGGRLLHPRSQ